MKTSDTLIALPLLPIRTVYTATHNYNTSALLPQKFLGAKDKQKPDSCFEVSTIFLHFFACQISCSNLWLDRSFQASA